MKLERPVIKWLKLDLLFVDPEYQRPIKEALVARIVADPVGALFGVLDVAGPDSDGRYAVWDGQQRLEALRRLGQPRWECNMTDVTPKQQAALFVQANGSRVKVTALDRHRAAVFAGDDQALAIQKAAEASGYEIGPAARGRVAAVVSLEIIEDRFDIDVVAVTLQVCRASWGDEPNGVSSAMIRGVGMFIGHHRRDLDDVDMVDQLASRLRPMEPRSLAGVAKGRWGSLGASGGRDVYRYLVETWNAGRRKHKVEAR